MNEEEVNCKKLFDVHDSIEDGNYYWFLAPLLFNGIPSHSLFSLSFFYYNGRSESE